MENKSNIVEHKMNEIKRLWTDIELLTSLDLLNVSVGQQAPCNCEDEKPGPLKKEFYFNFGKILRENNE